MKGRLFIHFVPQGSDEGSELQIEFLSDECVPPPPAVLTPGQNTAITLGGSCNIEAVIGIVPRGTTQAQAAIGKAEKVQP